MTYEHMCDRLATGEAERDATTPAEIVRYDGAHWIRSGDMWVRDDRVRRGAPTWLWRAPARRGTAEDGAQQPAADPDQATADQEPDPARAPGHRARPRMRRRRIVTGAACLATVSVSSVVLLDITGGDSSRPRAIPQLVTAAPQAAPTPDVAEPGPLAPPGPAPEDTGEPLAPTTPETEPVPTADTTPVANFPTPDPGPPPDARPSPVPSGTATPVPPPPDTPRRAAAALEAEVVRAAVAGQLSLRARLALGIRAERIRDSVDNGREGQARRRILNMRLALGRFRERRAISSQAVVVLDGSLDRVASTL